MARARKRKIVITYGSDSKVYDGSPLNCNSYTLSGDDIDPRDTLNVTVCSSQTLVGESNVHACELEGPTITGTSGIEYEIKEVYGTVTVTDGTGEDEEPVDDGLVVTVSADIGWPYDLGDEVTFNITATNIYDESRTIVLSEIEGVALSQGVFEDVEPGSTVETTATCTITQTDVASGHFTNMVTARLGEDFVKTAECTVQTGEAFASLNVAAVTTSTPANMESYVFGETISYQFTITNDGNTTVSDISAYAEVIGYESEDVTSILNRVQLVPGETATGTYLHQVTEQDILAESVEFQVTAIFEDTESSTIEVVDNTNDPVENANPSLLVAMSESSTRPNDGYALGDTISYAFTVTNNGNVTINNITASADVEGYESDDITSAMDKVELLPGETATGTYEYTVTEQDIIAQEIAIEITADGENNSEESTNCEADATTSTVESTNPSLFVAISESSTQPNGGYALGDTVSYAVAITNNGNLTIDNIEADATFDGYSPTDITANLNKTNLEPGKRSTASISHTVTEQDILNEGTGVSVDATGTDPDDNEIESTGSISSTVEEANSSLAAILLETSSPAQGNAYALGETVYYTLTIVNDGNLTIDNLSAGIANTGYAENNITSNLDKTEIAPGEYATASYTYTITQTDVNNGGTSASFTVIGYDPNDNEVEVTGSVQQPNPSLSLSVVETSTPANGSEYQLDEYVQFAIALANNGNTVVDDINVRCEINDGQWTNLTLAPGQSITYSNQEKCRYAIAEQDIIDGASRIEVTASGTFEDPDDVYIDDSIDIEVEECNGHITLTYEITSTPANGVIYDVGEYIKYKVIAVNDGNLVITNVSVVDELSGDEWTIADFRPGETKDFESSYAPTEDDKMAGYVVNVATATGDSPDPDYPDVPVMPGEITTYLGSPVTHLNVSITTTSTPENNLAYAFGEAIYYQLELTNDGNITVTDNRLICELTEELWEIDTLSPGGCKNFESRYAVKEPDIAKGFVRVEAYATSNSPDPEIGSSYVSEIGANEDPTEEPDPYVELSVYNVGSTNSSSYQAGDTLQLITVCSNTGNMSFSTSSTVDIYVNNVLRQSAPIETVLASINGLDSYPNNLTSYSGIELTASDISAGTLNVKATFNGVFFYPNENDEYDTYSVNSSIIQVPIVHLPTPANEWKILINTTNDTNSPKVIDLPCYSSGMTINWGDGTTNSSSTHTYQSDGLYEITMTANDWTSVTWQRPEYNSNKLNYQKCLISVQRKLPNIGSNCSRLFIKCSNLMWIPFDLFERCTSATTFAECFYACSSLRSIPASLFNNNTAATSFESCFAAANKITAVPADLFRYNVNATTFNSCFSQCYNITSIPTDLFRYNTHAQDFSYCLSSCGKINWATIPTDFFRYNTEATDFAGCFQAWKNLESIPVDLFKYNVQATSFANCFRGCTSLTTIPSDLFRYNTIATNFENCFNNCTSLVSIPSGLFNNNTSTTTFYRCFYQCSSIQSIPVGLFDHNISVTSFQSCFEGCTSLTTIPSNLFKYNTAVTLFPECFNGCNSLNNFSIHIGSSIVSNASNFVTPKYNDLTRIVYVPSGSTTQSTFQSSAKHSDLTIIAE